MVAVGVPWPGNVTVSVGAGFEAARLAHTWAAVPASGGGAPASSMLRVPVAVKVSAQVMALQPHTAMSDNVKRVIETERITLARRIISWTLDGCRHADRGSLRDRWPSRSRRHGTGPVSYTHLRAHETPEHLVC